MTNQTSKRKLTWKG